MTDEPRLPPLPDEALALLEAERARPLPEPEKLGRVYGRLALALGLPLGPLSPGGGGDPGAGSPPAFPEGGGSAGATGAGATGASGAAGAAGASGANAASGAAAASAIGAAAGGSSLLAGLLKPAALLTFALGAATGVGTTLVVQRTTPSPRAPTAVAVAPVRASAPAASVAPTRSPAAPPTRAAGEPGLRRRPASVPAAGAAKRVTRVDAGTPDERLAAERVLVERARSALARSRPSDALAALREHRARFKDGQLAEEREALSVVALASQGESERAHEVAHRFRKRYPRSLLLPAVSAALEAGQPGQVGDRERPKHLP
jgi:hypothetical protein